MRTSLKLLGILTLFCFAVLAGCAPTPLDQLERGLHHVGTITVKQPDVWGEARLTKHRYEFEKDLGGQVENFSLKMSALLRRSDAASATFSGALGLGEKFPPGAPRPEVEKPGVKLKTLTPVVPPITDITTLERLIPTLKQLKELEGLEFGLEPNEELRQRQSYIGVNQAMRRINAGDDISHMPGYAVYLMRFPISVIPGSKTKSGYRGIVTLSVRADEAIIISYLRDSRIFWVAITEAVLDRLYRERADIAQRDVEEHGEKRKPTRDEIQEELKKWFLSEEKVKVFVRRVEFEIPFWYLGSLDELSLALAGGKIELLRSMVSDNIGVLESRYRWEASVARGRTAPFPATTELKEEEIKIFKQVKRLGSDWMREVRTRVRKYVTRFQHEPLMAGLSDEGRNWIDGIHGESVGDKLGLLLDHFDLFAKEYGFEGFEPPMPRNVRAFLIELFVRTLYDQETPIYAFALDPVLEEQNAVDIFSRRRDLQLAMAFALARGDVTGKAAAEFVRRLELDMNTIALNRTVSAFNVGPATFGWVFSPRIQSPPDDPLVEFVNPANLFVSERTRDRARMELEPGTREVNAVLAIPAYLPEVVVTAEVNWIPINQPGKRLYTYSKIKNLRELAQNIEAQWYRGEEPVAKEWAMDTGKFIALQNMVPLKKLIVPLPYDHTASIVASIEERGRVSLSPAVVDVVPNQGPYNQETNVFITGRNFDINSTRVIVGGQEIDDDDFELMSRRLIKATVPKNNRTKKDVQIYVATPWGRSNSYPFRYLSAEEKPKPKTVTGKLLLKTLQVTPQGTVEPGYIAIGLSRAKVGASTSRGKSKITIVDTKGKIIVLDATYHSTVVAKKKIDQVVSSPVIDSLFAKKIVTLEAGEVSVKAYLRLNEVDEPVDVSGTLIIGKP